MLPDKLAWVIMFIAGLTLWGKKTEKRLSGADFSSVIWHQSREYCFFFKIVQVFLSKQAEALSEVGPGYSSISVYCI